MKKALVILMALSMVFAAFADEPAVKNEIVEFKGDATVTWGVNLDGKTFTEDSSARPADKGGTSYERYTGFKNEENASLKFTLIGAGDKSTTGEGVWGDIKVKIADVQYTQADKWNGKVAEIDYAKIHLADMLAIGIRTGDCAVGGYKPVLAAHSGEHKLGEVGGLFETHVWKGGASLAADQKDDDGSQKTEKAASQGITLEVALPDLLTLNVDFRSNGVYEAGKDGKKAGVQQYKPVRVQYTDMYGIAADVDVKAVADLSLKAGFGMDFWNWERKNEGNDWGLFVAADYKLALSDTMYVKPQLSFSMQNSYRATWYKENGTPDDPKMAISPKLIFAAFVGWGAENQDKTIKFLDKKVSDGFSIATTLDFTEKQKVDLENGKYVKGDMAIPLCIGAYDSTFVENLAVGFEFCTPDITGKTTKALDWDAWWNNGKPAKDYIKDMMAFTLAFDATYNLGVVTPTFGLKFSKNAADMTKYAALTATSTLANKVATLNSDEFKLYVACAYTGIANTTFTVAYESGNLIGKEYKFNATSGKYESKGKAGLGTINISAKVSF